ncbi:hypothetical protein JRG66_15205 [Salinimicrobium tongyeongense]|jgi:hypothetical protein|uniref:TM2 domain-containing protein n=1 Tax=Salinimicrobium tongyeongense TaxID=2809707 RepID=A0ABY6NS08_9FLAO|nr:hypothetical protein [Salinimicrobium tongyeongense]UZH55273.1 hypothetical protein JRG66_15205 [Salinimicrobium tongyeongense]
MTAAPRKNYFSLVVGIAFIGYGGYRIYTFLTGAEYTTFRIIIAIGFIVLGGFDLYKFFWKDKEV